MRTSQRAASEGFTLVELLIVLTLVGLLSAAVVIALPDPQGSLRSEAERFAARARAAQERALIGSRSVSVTVDPQRYALAQHQWGEWRPIDADGLSGEAWKDGTVAELMPAGRIVFDATGASEPARLHLRRGNEQAAVEIGSDGAIRVER